MDVATDTVRPAAPADTSAIARIYAHYVENSVVTFDEVPPTAEDWLAKLTEVTGRGLPFLVADDGAGRVLGFAYASPWRPKPAYRHTVEDTIYLDPACTGRGLGTSLLGALVAACAEAGMRQVIAVVSGEGAEASTALHQRWGFTPRGRLGSVGRKHGRWIDTLLLQLDLGAGT